MHVLRLTKTAESLDQTDHQAGGDAVVKNL